MKFSFVMTYWNRKMQLINTLNSIERLYKGKYDYEIIIVDDASDENERIEDLQNIYEELKVYRINDKEKGNRLNPSIPYNYGFMKSTGSIIVIQNPENIHIGNVLKSIEENIENGKYLTYGCYSATKEQTEKFNEAKSQKEILEIINPLFSGSFKGIFQNGWYNHSKYRPAEYHWLSAITKNDLFKIGGFDEVYAAGTSFDDDDFLFRIKQIYRTKIIDMPFCIHQFHNHPALNPNYEKGQIINKTLFKEATMKPNYKARKSILFNLIPNMEN